MIELCQKMDWTYQQYMKQPKWFLGLLLDKIRLENKEIKKQLKKAKRNGKRF